MVRAVASLTEEGTWAALSFLPSKLEGMAGPVREQVLFEAPTSGAHILRTL